MDRKAGDFAEGLFGDIFASFAESVDVEIQDSGDREERRCAPVEFHCDIVTFSKGFIDKLLPDMTNMPVLLCDNEDFFMRFTKSVCSKLAHNEDPEVGFLKAMAFLTMHTAMSFLIRCYRFTLDIPIVLRILLQEHIKTRFYEENGFDGISLRCRNLKEDEQWCESTVEEIRGHMKDSLETELAATTSIYNPYQPDRPKITILDVRSQVEASNPDSDACPYCCMTCIIFLKEFYKPRIRYKPGFEPM